MQSQFPYLAVCMNYQEGVNHACLVFDYVVLLCGLNKILFYAINVFFTCCGNTGLVVMQFSFQSKLRAFLNSYCLELQTGLNVHTQSNNKI